MSSTPYEHIAVITKTVGLQGEVVVTLAHNLFSLLQEGTRVWLTPPPRTGIYETTVCSVRELNTKSLALKIEGVDDRSTALDLVGPKVLVELDEELAFETALALDDLIIGRKVVDKEHGDLGHIVDILETGANDVWCIDGPFGEFMIPAIDEVVITIPRRIEVPIPVRLLKGLLPE